MNWVTAAEAELSRYVIVLSKCVENCHRDQHRILYLQHLAAGGLMLAEVHEGCSVSQLKILCAAEGRQYARESLSNYEGDLAVSLFNKLSHFINNLDIRSEPVGR
jgi:hypothetical protein